MVLQKKARTSTASRRSAGVRTRGVSQKLIVAVDNKFAPSHIYLTPSREARSNPGGLPNRRTGNGKCHRKIAPGFRTGKDEPAAAHSELKCGGSSGGGDGVGSQCREQAARGPLRQPHLLSGERLQEGPRLLCRSPGDEDHRGRRKAVPPGVRQ